MSSDARNYLLLLGLLLALAGVGWLYLSLPYTARMVVSIGVGVFALAAPAIRARLTGRPPEASD